MNNYSHVGGTSGAARFRLRVLQPARNTEIAQLNVSPFVE